MPPAEPNNDLNIQNNGISQKVEILPFYLSMPPPILPEVIPPIVEIVEEPLVLPSKKMRITEGFAEPLPPGVEEDEILESFVAVVKVLVPQKNEELHESPVAIEEDSETIQDEETVQKEVDLNQNKDSLGVNNNPDAPDQENNSGNLEIEETLESPESPIPIDEYSPESPTS